MGGYAIVVAVDYKGKGKKRGGGLACFQKNDWDVEVLLMSWHHMDMLVDDNRKGTK